MASTNHLSTDVKVTTTAFVALPPPRVITAASAAGLLPRLLSPVTLVVGSSTASHGTNKRVIRLPPRPSMATVSDGMSAVAGHPTAIMASPPIVSSVSSAQPIRVLVQNGLSAPTPRPIVAMPQGPLLLVSSGSQMQLIRQPILNSCAINKSPGFMVVNSAVGEVLSDVHIVTPMKSPGVRIVVTNSTRSSLVVAAPLRTAQSPVRVVSAPVVRPVVPLNIVPRSAIPIATKVLNDTNEMVVDSVDARSVSVLQSMMSGTIDGVKSSVASTGSVASVVAAVTSVGTGTSSIVSFTGTKYAGVTTKARPLVPQFRQIAIASSTVSSSSLESPTKYRLISMPTPAVVPKQPLKPRTLTIIQPLPGAQSVVKTTVTLPPPGVPTLSTGSSQIILTNMLPTDGRAVIPKPIIDWSQGVKVIGTGRPLNSSHDTSTSFRAVSTVPGTFFVSRPLPIRPAPVNSGQSTVLGTLGASSILSRGTQQPQLPANLQYAVTHMTMQAARTMQELQKISPKLPSLRPAQDLVLITDIKKEPGTETSTRTATNVRLGELTRTSADTSCLPPTPRINGRFQPPSVRLRKPCNCTKSQCLKLYCECFAVGKFCDDCNCISCANNLDHEEARLKAVHACLERNPAAFQPKIGKSLDAELGRKHSKGCNCKRSNCLKNYCECYEAKIACTDHCKCQGCKNCDINSPHRALMRLADAAEVRVQQQQGAMSRLDMQIDDRPFKPAPPDGSGKRLPFTFITQEVIDATCACLVATVEECLAINQSAAATEKLVLEEFGRCLDQVIEASERSITEFT